LAYLSPRKLSDEKCEAYAYTATIGPNMEWVTWPK